MAETLAKWRTLAEESIADAGEWKSRARELERDMRGTVSTLDAERQATALLRDMLEKLIEHDAASGFSEARVWSRARAVYRATGKRQ